MDLSEIRKEIDSIDNQISALFEQRMRLAEKVAEYKIANNLPVFQVKREEEILDRVAEKSPADIKNAARLLFTNLMDISKCSQQDKITDEGSFSKSFLTAAPIEAPKAVCPGVKGSYSETACRRIFKDRNADISMLPEFEDVFKAVDNGDADYGVVPIENSTAGGVASTYDLMGKYSLYIDSSIAIPVNHVLAVQKGTSLSEIKAVYSHEQAIRQCSGFLSENKSLVAVPYENTATAARLVSEHSSNALAAICSHDCAELYGLDIVAENIADNKENFTKFICIARQPEIAADSDIISLSLSLPHTSGALYRLLTRFAYCGVNLLKIESKPVPPHYSTIRQDTFDVIFYLDFDGSVKNPAVAKLLFNLQNEMNYFRFLGNYKCLES